MSIFWSWQSDLKGKTHRHFVKEVLELVVEELKSEDALEEADRDELKVDHDRKGVPGSPDLANTIFEKIKKCRVFVADVSTVGVLTSGKATINANVAIELGYALHAVSSSAVLLVANSEKTRREELPFDLRHKAGPIFYRLADDATKSQIESEKRMLVGELKTAVAQILALDHRTVAVPNEFKPTDFVGNSLYFDPKDALVERAYETQKLAYLVRKNKFFYIRVYPKTEAPTLKRAGLEDMLTSVGVMSRDGSFYRAQNKWGAIAYQVDSESQTVPAATQVFTSREIVSFETNWIDRASKEAIYRGIPTGVHENMIASMAGKILKLASELSGGPYVLELGMKNADGGYLFMGTSYWDPYWGPINESSVVHKAVLENANKNSLDRELLAFFEMIFDSAGKARPANFNNFPSKN